MSTEHAVTTKLCHWSNLQGGFLFHNSGERYVATRWHRIFWSKHNVMFQYVLVLIVKACQSHKVLRMTARPPLFARKSPAGQPMWHSNLMSLFLSIPDTWTTELVKAVNLSWWTFHFAPKVWEWSSANVEFSIARLYCQWANWHFCWLQCVAEWNPYFDGKIQFANYYILLQ